jgi:hydroxypyruvate reductase
LIERYGITPSPAIVARLRQDAHETPKPGSLPHSEFRLIATPMMALRAAAKLARDMGLAPLILGDALEGEAREVGIVHAGVARSVRAHGEPVTPPAVLLSGGETTVTIGPTATGRGGRNTTFLLGLALALDGSGGIWGIAGDTDGIDGMDDIAGAMLAPDTLARVRAKGLDPRGLLAAHDSHGFFDAAGDAIRIGPTLTNVNDFRAILIA